MKGNKGITLIALVITIIVLLILAGVSIAMLSGDNSILGNASKSADYNKIGEAKDQISLKVSEYVTKFLDAKYNGGDYPEGLTASNSTTDAVNKALDAVKGDNKVVKGVKVDVEEPKAAVAANPDATPPVEAQAAKDGSITVTSGEWHDTATLTSTGSVSWTGIKK